MTHHVRRTVLSLAAATAVVAATAVPAMADNVVNNGLVNVTLGRITLTDINVGVAAQIAAAVCGLDVGPVAVLATAVDLDGQTRTVCDVANMPLNLEQS
jgi:predicted nicotinamide N-methyase